MLHLDHASPWVFGLLANNVWSTTDGKQGGTYNNGLLQPFLNYNFKGGLYLTSSPILTANWKAEESGDIWTVPVGGVVLARSSTSANCRSIRPCKPTTTWKNPSTGLTGKSGPRYD